MLKPDVSWKRLLPCSPCGARFSPAPAMVVVSRLFWGVPLFHLLCYWHVVRTSVLGLAEFYEQQMAQRSPDG